MKNIVDKIRNIRKSKGISQEAMAFDLGIDYSTYGKIERGKIALTVERLVLISEILKVSVAEIFGYAWGKTDTTLEVNDKEIMALAKYVPYQKCPVCESKGFILEYDYGTGKIFKTKCNRCNGEGLIPMHVIK